MPEIMRERDRLSQVLVQRQRTRDGAADRCYLDGMGQSRAQMIACAIEENLRLILEPTKRARMNDARAIPLELRAEGMARLGIFPAARVTGFLCEGREDGPFV